MDAPPRRAPHSSSYGYAIDQVERRGTVQRGQSRSDRECPQQRRTLISPVTTHVSNRVTWAPVRSRTLGHSGREDATTPRYARPDRNGSAHQDAHHRGHHGAHQRPRAQPFVGCLRAAASSRNLICAASIWAADARSNCSPSNAASQMRKCQPATKSMPPRCAVPPGKRFCSAPQTTTTERTRTASQVAR